MKRITFVITYLLVCSGFAQSYEHLTKTLDSCISLGQYSDALKKIDQHQPFFKKYNLSEKIDILDRAAQYHNKSGNYESALLLNDSCIHLSPTKVIPNLYNTKGLVYMSLGQIKNARNNFEVAITQAKKLNDAQTLSDSYNNLALSFWVSGDLTSALEYHNQALDIRNNLPISIRDKKLASSLNNIGLVYTKKDPAKALEYYLKALVLNKKIYGEIHPKIALVNINIALIYQEQKKYDQSISMLEKALMINQKYFGESHPNVAFIYTSFAQIYAQNNATARALSYIKNALSIYKEVYGEIHPETANTYNLKGTIEMNAGLLKEAIASTNSAINSNTTTPYTDTTQLPSLENYLQGKTLLLSLYRKAQCYEERHVTKTLRFKDIKISYDYLEACHTLISQLRRETVSQDDKLALGEIANEIYEMGVRVSLRLASTSLKWKFYESRAFDFAEKSKSALLLESISKTNAQHFANIPDKIISKEAHYQQNISALNQKIAIATAKENEALSQTLFQQKKEYAALINEIKVKYPSYYNLKYDLTTTSIQEIQSSLDKDQMLISYFHSERTNYLYIFRITHQKLEVIQSAVSLNISKKILGIRNTIKYQLKKGFIVKSNELYQVLFPKNIEKGIQHLIIIPDSKLSKVPFGALVTKKPSSFDISYSDISYLINDYSLSYHFSASIYRQTKIKSQVVPEKQSILLCAPINFDDGNKNAVNLSPLPETENEVKAIERLFKTSGNACSVFLKENAEEGVIKSDQISQYQYIHFATHGEVNEKEPELSEIFLHKTDQEDGNLYCSEIYNLALNADLVTLSACQTGLGKSSKSEGLIGLSRALIYAGASNLIVSMWSVSDNSTAKMMVIFYEKHLEKDGLYQPYDRALQHAKRSLIQTDEYASPYYWAPFILIGR